jgi:hypothetical protein
MPERLGDRPAVVIVQFHQQPADHLAAALPGLPPGKAPGDLPQKIRQQRGPGIIRYRGSSDCRVLILSHKLIMIAAAAPLRGPSDLCQQPTVTNYSCRIRRAGGACELGRAEHGVALDGYAVCLFDGAQAGGYPGVAGGDGLAVAAAVRVIGQGLAVALDFADVGFAFVGVGGDGEHDGVGRGGVEDESYGLGFGVAAGQRDRPAVDLWPGSLGVRLAVSGAVVEVFEHGVGAVDLVAGGGEVLADRADLGAAGDGVLQEPGGFGLVGVVAGAGVDAQLGFEGVADGSGLDEADQALGEDGGLGPGG